MRNGPAPGWNAAACRWSFGCWRSTPRPGSPNTSTATSTTPMSTGRPCATCSHQGGTVDYTSTTITVTLDRPDTPRVARALEQLTRELNTVPAHLPGDRRPLTYQLAAA